MKTYIAIATVLFPTAAHAVDYVDVSTLPDQAVTGNDIVELLSGKAIKARVERGFDVEYRFAPDGFLNGFSNRANDTGTWSLEDGKLCLKFNRWNNACPTDVTVQGGKVYFGKWFRQK
ncbi:hypothetical protein [Ralstonia syzygii]|uniref:Uncharacterized protein n=1 Tax=Ralstonia syzygii R24 TaxID=907261 RepID=G3A7U8_9RALS|nr:hypothetical protein [Ralstonia syzygii]CCA86584.1 exported hypothetical protein [Ralstonia syzygii R24]